MKTKYYLGKDNRFVIENYNHAQPFADFFPGIAGKYGIPMWVFFVNRGQCICSFGTKDKDHAILEFFPANKSWQIVSLQGFRTFIKVLSGKAPVFYEPFHNGLINSRFRLSNKMYISSSDLKLEEKNSSLGLDVQVEYFTVPNDSFAAVFRSLTIKNNSKSAKHIQLLDGLPQIIPFGMNNWLLKELSRTLEAWMRVENLAKRAPFYKLAVDPSDKPEVIHIKEGNFYLSFILQGSSAQLLSPIVDPVQIFGSVIDFTSPQKFIAKKEFRLPKDQMLCNTTPCGFSFLEEKLGAGAQETVYTYVGYLRNKETLNKLIPRITKQDYVVQKRLENKKIIEELQNDIFTRSSSLQFDLYAKQTYLDNILRGGYPFIFCHSKSPKSNSVFYLYARKHGDLERDYNRFQIQPTYFSQGNGNYRDINQNRRSDIWFNPEVEDDNISLFFNLIQLDGFNPLVIKGVNYSLKDAEGFRVSLEKFLTEQKDATKVLAFLSTSFTPGDVILFLQENEIWLDCSYDEFLNELICFCQKNQEAEHGEGFWTDHWSYNLDLLESYFSIYPDKLEELIFKKKEFTYFDNSEIVKQRSEKYLLYNGLPRQLNSLAVDNQKKELIKKRHIHPHVVRQNYGEGDIYRTTLVNKLVCLALNKITSLDPFGIGIEMEANKPNWYDALNGLPALFGSSSCETFELKRLLIFVKYAFENSPIEELSVTEEIADFLFSVDKSIRQYFQDNTTEKDFTYWTNSGSLKESFRKKTRLGVSGNEVKIGKAFLLEFLGLAIKKLDLGLEKALDKGKSIYYSYFINEPCGYEKLQDSYIKPTKFKQKKLPFFLEAEVHALRLSYKDKNAKLLHSSVLKSGLFDKRLKMYKVTSSLKDMPEEIGRCRVFTPGWLENESVWLHMEYKYLLELLKSGLCKEFYHDFKNALIPFQKPDRYGRSILENCSFVVSSAYPDKTLHGAGFVARLSGSTAEFLQMWSIMNVGNAPFFLNEKRELNLRFCPKLAGWLFRKDDSTYSFNFLGKIKVTYHNEKLKDTFGSNPSKVKRICFADKSGTPVELKSNIIPSPYAEEIRLRLVRSIDIFLE